MSDFSLREAEIRGRHFRWRSGLDEKGLPWTSVGEVTIKGGTAVNDKHLSSAEIVWYRQGMHSVDSGGPVVIVLINHQSSYYMEYVGILRVRKHPAS